MDNFEVLADELKLEVVKEIHRATMIMPRREASKKGLGLMKKFMLAFKTRRFGAGVSLPLHLTMTSCANAAADDDDDGGDEYTNLCLLLCFLLFLFIYSSLSISLLLAFLISLYPYCNHQVLMGIVKVVKHQPSRSMMRIPTQM